MIKAERMFDLVQLAEASYASLDKFPLKAAVQNRNENNGAKMDFSAKQAEALDATWSVVTGGHLPNTESGYSSTLFQNNDTGSYVLAIRGTEPNGGQLYSDLLAADVGDIVIDGLAIDQIVDLYNEWQRISQNSYYAAYLETLPAETAAYALAMAGKFVPAANMTADAYLAYLRSRTDIVIDAPFGGVKTIRFSQTTSTGLGLGADIAAKGLTVAGHSLGGHLASAFTRLFPETGAEALTVNGAGYPTGSTSGLGGMALTNIANLFSMLGGDTGFFPARITNVYGDAMPEVVTMDKTWGLVQPGFHLPLYIEDTSLGNTLGHGSPQMTDSAAAYDLFIRLDPSLASSSVAYATSRIRPYIDAASTDDATTFEVTVDMLRKSLGLPALATNDPDDRAKYYETVVELTNDPTFKALSGKVTLQTPGSYAPTVRSDFGHFLALYHLTPFALKVTDATALTALKDANLVIATLWDADRSLLAGRQHFSDEWIADRGKLLDWITKANKADDTTLTGPQLDANWTFYDKAADTTVEVEASAFLPWWLPERSVQFGGSGADIMDGGDEMDHIYGGLGYDKLNGGKGNDVLDGMDGDDILDGGDDADTLIGGWGDDVMNGGTGFDIYRIGAGSDTITDTDGSGKLMDQNISLAGGYVKGTDGKYRLTLYSKTWVATKMGADLLIEAPGGAEVTIKGFSNGDLGVELLDVIRVTSGVFSDLNGTDASDDLRGTAGADRIFAKGDGDYVAGKAGEDTVYGGAGIDQIFGGDGADRLWGEADSDQINGDAGDDLVVGGAGQDFLMGGAGDDVIVLGDLPPGPTGIDTLMTSLLSPNAVQTPTSGANDVAYGMEGNDLLLGSASADAIDGGLGDDEIFGGASGDVLWGDSGIEGYVTSLNDNAPWMGIVASWYLAPTGQAYPSILVLDQQVLVNDRSYEQLLAANPWQMTWIDGNPSISFTTGLMADDANTRPNGGSDFLSGGAGNDFIDGGGGNDRINGGTDGDLVEGGPGDDSVFGDSGNDILFGDGYLQSIANHGNDYIDGGYGDDAIFGLGGSDFLVGGPGNDVICGEDGDNANVIVPANDHIEGGDGNDYVWGDAGDDEVYGGAGNDQLLGGLGNDLLLGEDGDDFIEGHEGDDRLLGGTGADQLLGDAGNDFLNGGDGNDALQGGEGNDIYVGGNGADGMRDVGGGDDTYYVGLDGGVNTIQDDSGNDTLVLDESLDPAKLIVTRNGDDVTIGYDASGDALRLGLPGTPIVVFRLAEIENIRTYNAAIEPTTTWLSTVPGAVVIQGTDGNDVLTGDSADEIIRGLAGNDVLDGKGGDDTLTGGAGGDSYRFGIGYGNDTIVESSDFCRDFKDELVIDSALARDEFEIRRTGDTGSDVTVTIPASGDSITMKTAGGYAAVDTIRWNGGWVGGDQLHYLPWYGTAGDDVMTDVGVPAGLVMGDGPIYAGDGNDTVYGEGNNDEIYGEGGDDYLDGGTGRDKLFGGTGDDRYLVDHGDDIVTENMGEGGDTVFSFVKYSLPENVENLSLQGTAAINGNGNSLANVVTGNNAANHLIGSRVPSLEPNSSEIHDVLIGAGGDDVLWSYAWWDTYYGAYDAGGDAFDGGVGNDELRGSGGSDIYVFRRGDGADTLYETAFISGADNAVDTLSFEEGIGEADLSYARGGNDLVVGYGGTDSLTIKGWFGSFKNRVEAIRLSDGTLIDLAAETMAMDGKHRPVAVGVIGDYSFSQNSSFTFVVPSNLFSDVDAGETLTLSASLAGSFGLPSWLSFDASSGTFSGTPDPSAVGSNEVLLTATDPLGGTASISFKINVSDVNDAPYVDASVPLYATEDQPFDIPLSSFVRDPDSQDVLTYSVTLSDGGPLPDWLVFDATTGSLRGTPGDAAVGQTALRVTAVDQTGAQGSGIVTLEVENVNDAPELIGPIPDQQVGAGSSGVLSPLSGLLVDPDPEETFKFVYQAPDGSEYAWLSWSQSGELYVNAPESLAGTTVPVRVTVFDGEWQSVTSEFNIYIGESELRGTSGLDTLTGTDGDDRIFGEEGDDVLKGLGGVDLLDGGPGNDVLDGGIGGDRLEGGTGDDTYVVDDGADTVAENPGEGSDTVVASITWSLGENIENLTLDGAGAIDATGNGLDNTLVGNAAANLLNGGAGNDRMTGGAGNDTYIVDSAGDTVVEQARQGIDVVHSSVTWTLGANVENLVLTGADAINGTGNGLKNSIIGNAANNVINGGGGADTMAGGLGDDTYVVNSASDQVLEEVGAGNDLVKSSVTFTLPDNVERLTLTGTKANAGSGNELDNVLTGNSAANALDGGAGNDTLNGMGGADTMTGGGGDDIYVVDNALDLTNESAGQGVDVVQSKIGWTLAAETEILKLTGTAKINGTGNELANLLTGNSSANVLNGAAGNDILEGGGGVDQLVDTEGAGLFCGGAGADTLTGGAGNGMFVGGKGNDVQNTDGGSDIIVFNRGDGKDVVNASVGTDDTLSLGGGISYSDITLTRSGADLVVKLGGTDQVTFKDWYASGSDNKSVLNLQVIADAMADFDAEGSDPMRNVSVTNFDFQKIVGAYDAARAATPTLTNWSILDALTDFQLNASDAAAIGGDLAYQYGKAGSLTNVGLVGAQNVIDDAGFGSLAQAFQASESLRAGVVRLSA